ncbi:MULTISPECIES: XRE family transcriptional regulator [unclassified Streptomyces]|uniref:XRE family transcriptional regulator n=1 Tax=unclassified Streptomyces TaxID=2593676 RepID=UPI000B833850|nr:XRE family transcriptional regulator [Streptomyces sp. DvalAA-14]MYS21211.1 XRE family transcriptional regulator [Streptomyces sp. SID4948]
MPEEFWQDDRLREALAGWHMGQVFYAYRVHPWHSRVVSQETLAGWLGLTQAQLSRIESASTAPQDLGKLMSWAHSLRIPGYLLWFKLPSEKPAEAAEAPPAAVTTQSPGDALLPVVVNGRPVFVPVNAHALAISGFGSLLEQSDQAGDASDPTSATEQDAMTSLNRRSVLQGSFAVAALPGLSLTDLQQVASALTDARRQADGPPVTRFRTQLASYKQDDGTLGPKRALPLVLGMLGAIEQSARDASANVRRELLSVGADGAEFAGWLYRDIHRPDIAGFWYDRAMEWAQEADDPAMQGYLLLKKSQMAYDERDAARLFTLAEAAANARWQLPRRVQAEVTQQAALGAAMLGEPLVSVRRKLEDAQALLGLAADDHHELGAYFTESTLLLRNAVTLTEAGKPGMAAELFGEVIAAGGLSVRDGGFFNARRAAALALSGEPDEAANVGRESAGVAHAMRSQRTVQVLGEVLQSLARWRSRPAVREFREALHVA